MNSLQERKLFNYPPFTQMVTLEYRHTNRDKSKDFISKLYNKLVLQDDNKKYDIVLLPNSMKRYNQFFFKIIIK